MSNSAGTQSRDVSTEQVTREDPDAPIVDGPVVTRLVDADAEPWPYTKIRDWIALLDQEVLSDGAFRLYYLSRSVIWENAKGGEPARPVVEITYEEYAGILGRCARTISRYADDLYATGLWEEIGRTSRSVRVPGKARPQVRTVLTVHVRDFPGERSAYAGPTRTWDVLTQIRKAKRDARGGTEDAGDASAQQNPRSRDLDASAGATARTPGSGQCDQGAGTPPCGDPELAGSTVVEPAVAARGSDGDPPGRTARTVAVAQSDQAMTRVPEQNPTPQDQQGVVRPAETGESPGGAGPKTVSNARTDLSEQPDVSAAHTPREPSLKKREEKEQPSLPPSPSAPPAATPASIADELAMFSADAIATVGELYTTAVGLPNAQPLSASDRAGLARRIDSRLAEGWSATRVRAVLHGGSLTGVRMPGRLWASRLDDMPAFPASGPTPGPGRITGRPADPDYSHIGPRPSPGPRSPRPAADSPRTVARPAGMPVSGAQHARPRSRAVNDSSDLPDPNAGKVRYETPNGRGRMIARWADERQVPRWCGRCASDARTLRPRAPGELPRPCDTCHPEPTAFPEPDHTAHAAPNPAPSDPGTSSPGSPSVPASVAPAAPPTPAVTARTG